MYSREKNKITVNSNQKGPAALASRRTFVVISNMAAVGGVCPFGVVTVVVILA